MSTRERARPTAAEALRNLVTELDQRIEGPPDRPWIPGVRFQDGRLMAALEGARSAVAEEGTREAQLFVLEERERELLQAKGPCSNGQCRLHYAHNGPCAPRRKGGPWTRHGHPIDGITVMSGPRPSVSRCGGPAICRECAIDAEQVRAAMVGQGRRCGSCDHLATLHDKGGCWFTVTTGRTNADLVCACSREDGL